MFTVNILEEDCGAFASDLKYTALDVVCEYFLVIVADDNPAFAERRHERYVVFQYGNLALNAGRGKLLRFPAPQYPIYFCDVNLHVPFYFLPTTFY
jgi:hypothetical protein